MQNFKIISLHILPLQKRKSKETGTNPHAPVLLISLKPFLLSPTNSTIAGCSRILFSKIGHYKNIMICANFLSDNMTVTGKRRSQKHILVLILNIIFLYTIMFFMIEI